jgi:uncharacterized membrane-anchored protein
MVRIEDHPLRYALANELHARPFPALNTPSTAVFLAIKPSKNAAKRDRKADFDHLIALLDRFGASHPKPDATHHFCEIGRHSLKWESHTEFVTYTVFSDGLSERPFDPVEFDVFPQDWLAQAPGVRMTSALIRIERDVAQKDVAEKLGDWFVPESLATSEVLDGSAIVAGDFRIDSAGHTRLAMFADKGCGPRRAGRIVQRLCEIETYKSMSMLGLARVRKIGPRMGELEEQLSQLVKEMTEADTAAEQTLESLLSISAELERMNAEATFRFGATGAYEALVNQRIDVLREERFGGRQTFAEFMMRRFDPAMRTVKSTERRLLAMADRAIRAGDLLRTRVDVERSAQNQELLESMDKRAGLQLRLQKTVEGLSVVAISYYAVNLMLYLTQPVGETLDISKGLFTAILTPIVVLLVWIVVRSIRRSMER